MNGAFPLHAQVAPIVREGCTTPKVTIGQHESHIRRKAHKRFGLNLVQSTLMQDNAIDTDKVWHPFLL